MDKKKINIAIEQLQKVHRDMNDCANRFILKDAIDQLQKQVRNCHIPLVSNPFNASEFEYSEFIKGKGKEYHYVSNKIHYFVNGELVKILNQ